MFISPAWLQNKARNAWSTTKALRLFTPSASTRLIMEAQTRADDGMDLLARGDFSGALCKSLPDEAELTAKADKWATDLDALRKSSGRRTHRLDQRCCSGRPRLSFPQVLVIAWKVISPARRRRRQTFTRKVGGIYSEFWSIVDDPH